MDRRLRREEEAIHRPGRFAPRAGGGENRQSAFGKAYQSRSPCLPDRLNRLRCARISRILSSPEVCRRGRDRPGGGREGPAGGVKKLAARASADGSGGSREPGIRPLGHGG